VALYELGLLLRTASGRVHPLAAYLGWLHDAGFEPPERHRLLDEALAVLLVARKPRAAEAGAARAPADQVRCLQAACLESVSSGFREALLSRSSRAPLDGLRQHITC
jgi:hypothetical protein